MDKATKKGLAVIMLILVGLLIVLGLDEWQKKKNKFVYEESLDEVVITVDERQVTLRQLSYYVYYVEREIDKQARIYNREDPLDYWNTYFNSGLKAGYISEMAEDAILGSCVCDMIYEQMAIDSGYELTSEEKEETGQQAERIYATLSQMQKDRTGLTTEIIDQVLQRKALVVKFASEYFESVDFSGYSGYREELVSYAGEYYQKEILPLHDVNYNQNIVAEWKIGRVTTDYEEKY